MTKNDEKILEKFRMFLRTHGKQPATIESYSRDAEEFLRYMNALHLPMNNAEPQTMLFYADYLTIETAGAENSVRRKIIGIRQFYRFLASERIIFDSPFDEMPLPRRDESLNANLDKEDIEIALQSVTGRPLKAARDRTILQLLAFEGIKANELIQLKWVDCIRSGNRYILKLSGTKARTISVNQISTEILSEYSKIFSNWISDVHSNERDYYQWVFLAFKGKDCSVVLPQITRHGLKFMLSELGERAAVKHLHTEALRHHAINHLIKNGKNAEDIMSHLGLRRLGNIAKHLAIFRTEHEV